MKHELLKKYAQLAIHSGVNLQKGQTLLLSTSVEAVEFTREVVKAAYEAGAKQVVTFYEDELLGKLHFQYQSEDTLQEVHDWQRDCRLDYLKQGACTLRIISEIPGNLKDCDAKKVSARQRALAKLNKECSAHTMASTTQWCIVAAPNTLWAKQVFPNLEEEDANEALWNAILKCVYVDEEHDPIQVWCDRDKEFQRRMNILNDYNFKQLHFVNSLGTDLYVGLVEHHIWAGGSEKAQNGVIFNANMPTEEVFCMPKCDDVQGRVVATRPLLHNGKLIENFEFTFVNGAVSEFNALVGKDVLDALLNFDEGSKRLGEVALVSDQSPISQSGILFLNTLFDENASCHLALGDAYPMCVEGGIHMSEEELKQAKANHSLLHVDFMFGSTDMRIQGECQDGHWVDVFENGNFVF